MTTITSRDQWLQLPQGGIFARRWQHAEHSPQGNPIILLHDSLGCVELWRDFPAALCQATDREVIAYDRLGFGRSDARTELPALDFVAEESRDFFPQICTQLAVEGFVLLGHSVGGGMAIQCAAEWSGRCEALVTLAAQVFPEDRTLAGIEAARKHFRAPERIERLAKYHGNKARWVLDAWTENWLHPGFSAWTLVDVLARISCPLLAIHGEKDEYGSSRHPELISQLSNGPLRVEILSGVGHWPQRERPQTVLKFVSELLQQAHN
ncbi:alpha/beta hydrolase [Xanthomonas campestris pv. passiflorae]|uniref:alpha/beta fold hydrolase n=1 Tax=Xanthomonas campestris TaxID=339 RepID=UPI002425D904|nr:alpha/beta hydrolase [Xanthomonas campestris]MBV6816292.1 alpha/beta hydrolase [Xanthomonas campestris pv. passiflorae]